MEYWEAFQRFEFSNETLIVVGGLLVLLALVQIVQSSIKMFFWVFVAVIGSCSALYGYDRSSVRLPDELVEEARNLAGPGSLTNSMMQALCLKVLNNDTASMFGDSNDTPSRFDSSNKWAELFSSASASDKTADYTELNYDINYDLVNTLASNLQNHELAHPDSTRY